jgi:hypothetical protein
VGKLCQIEYLPVIGIYFFFYFNIQRNISGKTLQDWNASSVGIQYHLCAGCYRKAPMLQGCRMAQHQMSVATAVVSLTALAMWMYVCM